MTNGKVEIVQPRTLSNYTKPVQSYRSAEAENIGLLR
jgi:hypothetical protein